MCASREGFFKSSSRSTSVAESKSVVAAIANLIERVGEMDDAIFSFTEQLTVLNARIQTVKAEFGDNLSRLVELKRFMMREDVKMPHDRHGLVALVLAYATRDPRDDRLEELEGQVTVIERRRALLNELRTKSLQEILQLQTKRPEADSKEEARTGRVFPPSW